MRTVVIIGGVAGGASAAARLRRLDEKADIIILEKGPHISFAACGLPYYIGGEIANRAKLLVQTPQAFRARFAVDVRTNSQAICIDRTGKSVEVLELRCGLRYRQKYDKLILSPGAAPIRPKLPGVYGPKIFSLRSLKDADRLKSFIENQHPERACVVGGGFVGLEMAENLRRLGLRVTIIDMADQVMPALDREMAEFVHQHLGRHDVELVLGEALSGFEHSVDGPVTTCLAGGGRMESDLVILAIGVRPEIGLAQKAGLKIGPLGGVKVNEHLQTSDEDIYAIGDASEVAEAAAPQPALMPLAGVANRQGRIAAENICGRQTTFRATLGTIIVRVFDLSVASTGANEKGLRTNGVAYLKSYTHSVSHAGYFPGATPMAVKLLLASDSGKVLGAQIVGVDGVDKRIDVLATAIRAGATASDLTELELAYAPPYGEAKDPVNMAGYVAENILKGDVKPFYAEQLGEVGDNQIARLDVRTRVEFERGHIAGAVNIPVDEIRDRIAEVPCQSPLLVYCQSGARSYFACRALAQMGYEVMNLSGGYVTYCASQGGRLEIPQIERYSKPSEMKDLPLSPQPAGPSSADDSVVSVGGMEYDI